MAKRVVLITGCSDGGLGAALSIAFNNAGFRVIATARNESKLSEVKAAGIETVILDIESEKSVQAAAAKVKELTGGHLDILVNNAGRAYSAQFSEIDLVEFKRLFETNVFSMIVVTQAFLPLLLQASKGAIVVNNTSVLSTIGLPFDAPYGSSKAALASISESLRMELAPFHIKVVDLKTGGVKSNIVANEAANEAAIQRPASKASLYNLGASADGSKPPSTEDTMERIPRDVWASKVVSRLQKSNPPLHLWAGANSLLLWFVTWLPVGTLDSHIRRTLKLDSLIATKSNAK